LTKTEWKYLKVLQREFEGLHPDNFAELLNVVNPPELDDYGHVKKKSGYLSLRPPLFQ
jgi:hypothetical protein